MDNKISKLQALLGRNDVWKMPPPPSDVVAGPITPAHAPAPPGRKWEYDWDGARDLSEPESNSESELVNPGEMDELAEDFKGLQFKIWHEFTLQPGQHAAKDEGFCTWRLVEKYPQLYIGVRNGPIVERGFFANGKLYDQAWDFFYLPHPTVRAKALVLVTTKQFQDFLNGINKKLGVSLSIPSSAAEVYETIFDDDQAPRPRYLGREFTEKMPVKDGKNMASQVVKDMTPDETAGQPANRSFEAYKRKVDAMMNAQNREKSRCKRKKKAERIVQQQSWGRSIKHLERYLGLRKANDGTVDASGFVELSDGGENRSGKVFPVPAFVDPAKPAPFEFEDHVVFISVDVEAYERPPRPITEVGIAILDTNDLRGCAPGENGVNWMSKIQAHHFRIKEFVHLENTEFVKGCADRFEFGTSEFVSMDDIAKTISTYFKEPFGKEDASGTADKNKATGEPEAKRRLVLVGHEVGGDITYLRKLGYDIDNLSNLKEVLDTSKMWQFITRDSNPRALNALLCASNIMGWNLHNAGNDATYTLQAMVSIALRHTNDYEFKAEIKEKASERIDNEVKNARMTATEREEGWSSGGEYSDGGVPISPFRSGLIHKQRFTPLNNHFIATHDDE